MNSWSLDPYMYGQCLAWKKGNNNTWKGRAGQLGGEWTSEDIAIVLKLPVYNQPVGQSIHAVWSYSSCTQSKHTSSRQDPVPVRSLVMPNSLSHLGPGKPLPSSIELPIFGILHQWRHIICDLLCLMYFWHFFRAEPFVVCISALFYFGGRIVF